MERGCKLENQRPVVVIQSQQLQGAPVDVDVPVRGFAYKLSDRLHVQLKRDTVPYVRMKGDDSPSRMYSLFTPREDPAA